MYVCFLFMSYLIESTDKFIFPCLSFLLFCILITVILGRNGARHSQRCFTIQFYIHKYKELHLLGGETLKLIRKVFGRSAIMMTTAGWT